jgi:DNA repair photolyase
VADRRLDLSENRPRDQAILIELLDTATESAARRLTQSRTSVRIAVMRWAHQAVAVNGTPVEDGALPGLQRIGFLRSVRSPQFDGITFHEVMCKSALNKVPNAAALPFRYTVNGYRGCSHACRYCFARPTHEYLELDCGNDFDTQVVVKTNVVEVLRRELRRPSWQRETVALGTNTDPYQRAEGRYALMPGIIGALAESGTPLSILTKGTLLRRDLPLIAQAAAQVPVSVAVSLAVGDPELHKDVEPGTPTPQARLALIGAIRGAGLECHVMVAPVLPHLTDSVEHLDGLLGQIAAAGASSVTVFGLHLRSSTRGWFMAWLARSHPELVGRYRELYRRGAYLPQDYREALRRRVAPLIARHGLAGDHRPFARAAPAASAPEPIQPTLF